ncbi:MAG TPA: hypothetical protein VFS67_21815 [Polyangiaceae bacterium]|nr:hypothetical protein [Polyangiaceae bacterium]
MAIQSVTIKFSAKKTNNQAVVWTNAAGTTMTELVGTAASKTAAEAQIQSQIDASIAIASGNLQDQQDASGAFNI